MSTKYAGLRFVYDPDQGYSDSVPANAGVYLPGEVFDTEADAESWVSTLYSETGTGPAWAGYFPVTFVDNPDADPAYGS